MIPVLPADDPNPSARTASLEDDRKTYRFDTSIGGLPLAAEVPRGEGYSMRYMAEAVKVEAVLEANRLRTRTDSRLDEEREAYDKRLRANGFLASIKATAADKKARGLIAAPLEPPSDLGDYDALLKGVPAPSSRTHAEQEAFFAYQRVAGCNPAYIRRYAGEIPTAGLQIDGDDWTRAEQQGRGKAVRGGGADAHGPEPDRSGKDAIGIAGDTGQPGHGGNAIAQTIGGQRLPPGRETQIVKCFHLPVIGR